MAGRACSWHKGQGLNNCLPGLHAEVSGVQGWHLHQVSSAANLYLPKPLQRGSNILPLLTFGVIVSIGLVLEVSYVRLLLGCRPGNHLELLDLHHTCCVCSQPPCTQLAGAHLRRC